MKLPDSVLRAIWGLRALVLVGAVTAAMVVLFRDDLIASWSVGHPIDSAIKPPAFVPVALVLFVVTAGLILVLVPFLRTAHPWARYSLVTIVLAVLLATVAGLRTDPPVVFVVISAASILLEFVILALLFHRDTSAFLRGSAIAIDA